MRSDYLYNVGDIIEVNSGKVKIIERSRNKKGLKIYKYECLECGYKCGEVYSGGKRKEEHWTLESSLRKGSGCFVCGGKGTATNINSIFVSVPNYKELGINEEDAKRYRASCNCEVEIICSNCGSKHKKRLDHVIRNNNCYCSRCGDGFSYPEKLIANILTQLDLDYIYQLSSVDFDWCGRFRYDFYIPSIEGILEAHGRQHYERGFSKGRTLKEEQENDKCKYGLALQNEINQYIVIDCRKSELEWIKNNILNSKLNELFDLSKIDWLKAHEFALGDYKKQICEMWEQYKDEFKTIVDFKRDMDLKITKECIKKYLTEGTELGWCNYNPKEEIRKRNLKTAQKSKERDSVPVHVLKDGEVIIRYNSFADLEKFSLDDLGVKICKSVAYNRCSGKITKPYKEQYTFEYAR